MNPVQAKKIINDFLGGRGGTEEDLVSTGTFGRDHLLHLLQLPSTKGKKQALIPFLLVRHFFDDVVERALCEFARAHPDIRIREIRAKSYAALIASRPGPAANLESNTE